jgi:hypothetical protein
MVGVGVAPPAGVAPFAFSPGIPSGVDVGLAGGLTHMLMMLRRDEEKRPPEPPRGAT